MRKNLRLLEIWIMYKEFAAFILPCGIRWFALDKVGKNFDNIQVITQINILYVNKLNLDQIFPIYLALLLLF